MGKINIKGYDIDTQAYFEQNKKIIQKIKSLNFKGSEYLNFDDIAVNYSINGINSIIKFCNNIYNNGVKHLIVFASHMTRNLIKSTISFILGKNNYTNQKRIMLHFINGQDQLYVIKQKLDKYFDQDENNNIAICFADGFYDLSEQKNKDIVNILMSKFSERSSHFLIDKLIYFLGKKEWLSYLKNHKIPNKNIRAISSDLNHSFYFFNDLTLTLLATQGINIKKLVAGYSKNQHIIYEYDLTINLALKLAWFLTNFNLSHKEFVKLNLFISYDKNLDQSAKSIMNFFKPILEPCKVFCDYLTFPSDISKIGQAMLTSKLSKVIIYLKLNQNNLDFQGTTDVQYDALLNYEQDHTLNHLKNISHQVFNNYLLSYNNTTTSIDIEFAKQNEEAYGEFIQIMYWTRIFFGIINDLNPFEIN